MCILFVMLSNVRRPSLNISEGFGTPRFTAQQFWRPVGCSLMVSQIFYINYFHTTFVTLRPLTDSVLYPHVLTNSTSSEKRGRAVNFFTFELLCSMSSSMVVSQMSLVCIFFFAARLGTRELNFLHRQTVSGWIQLHPFDLRCCLLMLAVTFEIGSYWAHLI